MREKSGFYYLYIFRLEGTDYYKIGITDQLRKRLCSINTSNPTNVLCVASYRLASGRDANTFEGYLHEMFKGKRLCNTVTKKPKEWFVLDDQDLNIIEHEYLLFCQIPVKTIPPRLENAFQYAQYLRRYLD